MPTDAFARLILPWTLTWLAHSTALLLLVWGLVRVTRSLAPRTRVVLWRVGVLGPLVTATLPFVVTLPTTGVRIALPEAAPAVTDAVRPSVLPPRPMPPTTALERGGATPPQPAAAAPLARSAASPADRGDRAPALSWLAFAWVAIAGLLVVRGIATSVRIRRRLARRQPVDDAALRTATARLAARAGIVRVPPLTVSDQLSSPIAWGVLAPEICVPRRALERLTRSQQEAMLAHELAHVARRDALWLAVERWLLRLLFVQPLLHVARRRIREQTELACDARAVELTKAPVALAECLAEVAGWRTRHGGTAVAPAMAATPSLLARRVEHLLERGDAPAARSSAALGAALLLLLGVGLGAPGFTDAEAAAPAGDAPPATEALAAPTSIRDALRAIDDELALTRAALDELATLGAALDAHPELRSAIRRLVDRANTLDERRHALRRAALGDDR